MKIPQNKLVQRLFLSVFLVATPVLAQNTFPPNQSPAKLKKQIQRLDAQSRVMDEMIRQAAIEIYGNAGVVVHSMADLSLGPIFGRERDYTALINRAEAVETAVQSGDSPVAVLQAIKACKQFADLVSRPIALVTGEPFELPSEEEILQNPEKFVGDVREKVNEVEEVKGDLEPMLRGLSGLGQAMQIHQALLQIKHRINQDRSIYQQQLAAQSSGASAADTNTSNNDNSGSDSTSFDPSKLSPEAYAGWQRTQAIVRDETFAKSSRRLEQLRRQADQADEDLKEAQQELEVQQSADASSNADTGDLSQFSGAQTFSTGPQPQPSQINAPGFPVPSIRNDPCNHQPCMPEGWDTQNPPRSAPANAEDTSQSSLPPKPASPADASKAAAAVSSHTTIQPAQPSRRESQPADAKGIQKPNSAQQSVSKVSNTASHNPPPPAQSQSDQENEHAWMCQQFASWVRRDKSALSSCGNDPACHAVQAGALKIDLSSFNSEHCDPALLK